MIVFVTKKTSLLEMGTSAWLGLSIYLSIYIYQTIDLSFYLYLSLFLMYSGIGLNLLNNLDAWMVTFKFSL